MMTTTALARRLSRPQLLAAALPLQQQRLGVLRATAAGLLGPPARHLEAIGAIAVTGDVQPVSAFSVPAFPQLENVTPVMIWVGESWAQLQQSPLLPQSIPAFAITCVSSTCTLIELHLDCILPASSCAQCMLDATQMDGAHFCNDLL